MDNDEEITFTKGYIAGLKEAVIVTSRGPWWYFRDWVARSLHYLATRIEPDKDIS